MRWRTSVTGLSALAVVLVSGAGLGHGKLASAPSPPTSAPASQPESLPAGGFQVVPDKGNPKDKGAHVERGVRLRPERVLVGLEITPGVAIPFGNYLDFGDSGAHNYFLENGIGFALSVSLTLNRLELRYAYASLSTGRVKAELPGDVVDALNIYNQAAGLPTVSKTIDLEAPSNLKMHHLSLGYRITWEIMKTFNLVFPIGVGLVVAQPPDFGIIHYSLFGVGAFAGVRPEITIADLVAIGIDARFSTFITEPDANLAGAGYAATKKVFDNAIAWLPMLSVAVSARVYY